MPRDAMYGEPKQRKYFTLTQTAIQWLESKKEGFGATSLSDTIERLAREDLRRNA